MPVLLRPYVSRFIAALVASMSGWLTQKAGIGIDADTQAAFVQIGVFVMLLIYGLVHRLLDRWLNPGDAASSHLAKVEAVETARLKGKTP